MALSVLDLPFEAGKHEITADGDRARCARRRRCCSCEGDPEDREGYRPAAAAARRELLPPRRPLSLRERRTARCVRHRRVPRRRRLRLPGHRHQPDVEQAHDRCAAADPGGCDPGAEGLLDQGHHRRTRALRDAVDRVCVLLPGVLATSRTTRPTRPRRANSPPTPSRARCTSSPTRRRSTRLVGARLAAGHRGRGDDVPRHAQRATPRSRQDRLAHEGPRVLRRAAAPSCARATSTTTRCGATACCTAMRGERAST
jgi:hypothetical protein